MEVELVLAIRHLFPGRGREEAPPVVGREEVPFLVAPALPDDVVGTFLGRGIFLGLHEPFVLVARVVHREVEEDPDAP